MDDLKGYKNKEMQYFIRANLLIILIFSIDINHNYQINSEIIYKLFPYLGSMGVIYIYSIILDGLISPQLKDDLAFMPKKILPGNKAFNKLLTNKEFDVRVSTNGIKKFYSGTLNKIKKSNDKMIQNKLWYSFYQEVQTDSKVFKTQYNYLLMRDINAINIILSIFYLFIGIVPYAHFNYKVEIYFLILCIITIVNTNIYSRKFIKLVLISYYSKYSKRKREHNE